MIVWIYYKRSHVFIQYPWIPEPFQLQPPPWPPRHCGTHFLAAGDAEDRVAIRWRQGRWMEWLGPIMASTHSIAGIGVVSHTIHQLPVPTYAGISYVPFHDLFGHLTGHRSNGHILDLSYHVLIPIARNPQRRQAPCLVIGNMVHPQTR